VAAIKCNPTVLINNQLYNPSYEDTLRTEMMDIVFPKVKPLIATGILKEKRGVDSECLWTQSNYYYALIEMMIGFRREVNSYIEKDELTKITLENLEEEWKFKCIRKKLTCIFGDGTMFDSLYETVKVGFDGLDFMILEGDNDLETPDFLIP
jgi:hypothetical protein